MNLARAPYLLVCGIVGFMAAPSAAVDRGGSRHDDHRDHPGCVDGSSFAELADKDDTLIEVSLHGPLLGIVAKAMAEEEPEFAQLLKDIVAINAVVVGVGEKSDRAKRMVDEMVDNLSRRGWESIARVREANTSVAVMALFDDDAINGLAVFVSEPGQGQLVFANIAGRLNLEVIGNLGSKLNIPGLDQLTGVSVKERVQQQRHQNQAR